MMDLVGIIAALIVCYPLMLGVHNAIEYGRREGLIAKKYPDEDCSSSESEAME